MACKRDGQNRRRWKKVEWVACRVSEVWCGVTLERRTNERAFCTQNCCHSLRPTSDKRSKIPSHTHAVWNLCKVELSASQGQHNRRRQWTRPNFEVKQKKRCNELNCLWRLAVTFCSNYSISFVHNQRATEAVRYRISEIQKPSKKVFDTDWSGGRWSPCRTKIKLFFFYFRLQQLYFGHDERASSSRNEAINKINLHLCNKKKSEGNFIAKDFGVHGTRARRISENFANRWKPSSEMLS